MTLYILKYNNYYNRLVKREDSMEDYEPYIIYTLLSTNFNPNDGVNATQVIGAGEYDGMGDYLIAYENDIVSRWFIIESLRTRAGQYQLVLRRDLVVDYYNVITLSPMFIEKATITDVNDTALFNREGMTFNQIKRSEDFLTDETHCPWIVGYIPESLVTGNNYNGEQLIFDYAADSKNFVVVNKLDEWDGYKFYDGTYVQAGTIEELYYGYGVNVPAGDKNEYWVRKNDSGDIVKLSNSSLPYNGYYFFKDNSPVPAYQISYRPDLTSSTSTWNVFNTWLPNGWSTNNVGYTETSSGKIFGVDFSNYIYQGGSSKADCKIENVDSAELGRIFDDYVTTQSFSAQVLSDFKNKYDGQLLKDSSTGLFYKVRVVKSTDLRYIKRWLTVGTDIYNYLNSRLNKDSGWTGDSLNGSRSVINGTPTNNTYFASVSYYGYTLNLEPVYQYAGVTLDSSVYELNDQPYFMFCAPYTDDVTVVDGTTVKYIFNKQLAISLATLFAGKIGRENIFDMLLLPYCPARYAVNAFMPTPGWNGTSGTGDYANVKTPYIFDESVFSGLFLPIVKGTKTGNDPIVLTNEEIGKVFWATSGNFSFDIVYSIPTKDTALDIKVSSETELYRLCSPNYSGIFEFDPYMNSGIQTFNVDCSYKPFNPYIHLNPNFNYLYGSDFNDQRGLIILGDFSLPQETDAWTQYELNNKNYQQMFDRQIQNLKVNQDVQRKQQVFNAATGTISGMLSGATTGALAGGGWGALAGAVVGGAASGVGGALDVKYVDLLRNEALDYTKDMYNYNLGNIQALPNGMTKTSPLTANFKYFPFIEKYSCTTLEELAFRNKLYYNGMTIMRIGTMNDFITDELSYIKGQLIRFTDDGEDYHVVNSIAGELVKGVFI